MLVHKDDGTAHYFNEKRLRGGMKKARKKYRHHKEWALTWTTSILYTVNISVWALMPGVEVTLRVFFILLFVSLICYGTYCSYKLELDEYMEELYK